MSGWVRYSDEVHEGFDCIRMEWLSNDRRVWLGSVMQFYEEHYAHATCIYGRIGRYKTFEAAKMAVEKVIERGNNDHH